MDNKIKKTKTADNAVFANIDDIVMIVEEKISEGADVELPPRGISMLPLIRQGKDSVILSAKKGRLKKYDIARYRRSNGDFVLHRIVDVKPESYTISGDNQYVYEKGIGDDQIIAVVTAIRRGGRIIKAKSPIHIIYASVWHHTRSLRHLFVRAKRKISRIINQK